jgi:pantetheine-phosphate adenylyltransferase
MIAVYAGSFDPFHDGHLSVVRRAARLFAHVRVLVAVHPTKAPLFDLEARTGLIRDRVRAFANVSVDSTEGFVAEYARGIGGTVLVRGVRGAEDAVSEVELSWQNRALAPELLTVWLPAEPGLESMSSTSAKAAARSGEALGIPEDLARIIEQAG